MMRSMYSGVAGLKTHQTKMDVIGNNIANVNTVAYKSQSVTFSELMYQTTQSASGANAVTGTAGINARQIGLGVKTGAINTAITSQGASQTTNNPFDIRITGDSFFIVNNGQDNFFTRDGSFYVDGLGNLAMTSNGYNVMGWQVDPETMDIKQDTVSALRVMSEDNMTYPPEATSRATVSGILDKNDTNVTASSGKTMNLMFYDNLGYSYTAKMIVKNTDEEGHYTVQLGSIVDSNNEPIALGNTSAGNGVTAKKALSCNMNMADYGFDLTTRTVTDKTVTPAKDTVLSNPLSDDDYALLAKVFNANSATELKSYKFTATDYDTATPPVGTDKEFTLEQVLFDTTTTVKGEDGTDSTLQAYFGIDVANVNTKGINLTTSSYSPDGSVELVYDTKTGAFDNIAGGASITLKLAEGLEPAGRFSDIVIDFSTTTMYNNSGTSTIAAASGDMQKLGTGRKLGEMSGISIQDDGRIYASYDNGMSKLLGQIAVAKFANASGLEKSGDNLYKSSQNSGEFDGIGIDIKSGSGYMTTGVLEMSNVDLSAEFTDMITTQRGFQANSRIITVSDTLLEELVNLKR